MRWVRTLGLLMVWVVSTARPPQTGTLTCAPVDHPEATFAWTDPNCFHTLRPIEGGRCTCDCTGTEEDLECRIDPKLGSNEAAFSTDDLEKGRKVASH